MSAVRIPGSGNITNIFATADVVTTDDRGAYRIFGLLPGEYVVAAVPRVDALYMRSMAVRRASGGAGCGRRLVEAVERHAAAHGFATVVLSTTPFLDSAIALYERCGFRRTDAGPLDLAGTPLLTMEKILEARST